jgi:hypothetical protein
MKKKEPRAYDVLDNLVAQFSDPMCFLRELVQNSLDAGSSRVEISFEFLPGDEPRRGVMVIHVDDWGEGMNRESIDGQLTRLFSSSKEGDLTKIGKFGIGFVSVFAIDPDGVIVDTSRDGESWRLFFNRDRTFERIVREEPVEGTKIQVIKETTRAEYDKRLQEGKKVAAFWCRHAEADIFFQGERINEPVDLPCLLKVCHEEAGTLIVAGYTLENPPCFGFYNKGLTLMEGRHTYYSHVTFKVSSRYLEHTLTRDSILQDENYEKAMALLRRVATESLPEALFDALEKASRRGLTGVGDEEAVRVLLGCLKAAAFDLGKHETRQWIPTVDGGFLSLADLRKASSTKWRFLYDSSENDVTRSLRDQGITVFKGERSSAVLDLVAFLLNGAAIRATSAFVRPRLLEAPQEGSGIYMILGMMPELLSLGGRKVRRAVLGDLSCNCEDLFVLQEKPGDLSPRSLDALDPTMVLNAAHPSVSMLLKEADRRPVFAAYVLAKLILLGNAEEGLDGEREGKILAWCLVREQG